MASPGIGLGVSSDAGGVFGYVGLRYSAALLLLMQPARHAAAPRTSPSLWSRSARVPAYVAASSPNSSITKFAAL